MQIKSTFLALSLFSILSSFGMENGHLKQIVLFQEVFSLPFDAALNVIHVQEEKTADEIKDLKLLLIAPASKKTLSKLDISEQDYNESVLLKKEHESLKLDFKGKRYNEKLEKLSFLNLLYNCHLIDLLIENSSTYTEKPELHTNFEIPITILQVFHSSHPANKAVSQFLIAGETHIHPITKARKLFLNQLLQESLKGEEYQTKAQKILNDKTIFPDHIKGYDESQNLLNKITLIKSFSPQLDKKLFLNLEIGLEKGIVQLKGLEKEYDKIGIEISQEIIDSIVNAHSAIIEDIRTLFNSETPKLKSIIGKKLAQATQELKNAQNSVEEKLCQAEHKKTVASSQQPKCIVM